MLSDEWLSRYGLLENFNASVTRTRTGTGTGTWTTGVTAIALCTSCSRANKCLTTTHSRVLSLYLPARFFPKEMFLYSLHGCRLFDITGSLLTPRGGTRGLDSDERQAKLYMFVMWLPTDDFQSVPLLLGNIRAKQI